MWLVKGTGSGKCLVRLNTEEQGVGMEGERQQEIGGKDLRGEKIRERKS